MSNKIKKQTIPHRWVNTISHDG